MSLALAASPDDGGAASSAASSTTIADGSSQVTMWVPGMFKCPISGDLLEDPVVAQDGNTYSRVLLEEWFVECLSREDTGQQAVSPVTRLPMGTKLAAREDYAAAIAEIRAEYEKRRYESDGPVAEGEPAAKKRRTRWGQSLAVASSTNATRKSSSLNQLGAVFAHLDPLRDLLAKCLDGWEPPQLVVVGNENCGKSSVLERLCMMPIFPRDEELCTRIPIHVRLRRGIAKAPQLEVTSTEGSSVKMPISVPAECAHDDVRRTMESIVREQNADLTGVASDRKILLHVQSPNVPTLDLVDLPGVVAAAVDGEPSNMPEQTKDLVQQHIRTHKDRSVFLACVDAPTAPNSSIALQVLVQQQVLDQAIGVITRCDYAVAPQQKEKIRKRLTLAAGSDAVKLKHGYVATMNAPVVGGELSNLQRLQQQADQELDFFEDYLPSETDTTTTIALLSRVEAMFLDHVKKSWIPTTLVKLDEERKHLTEQNAQLGLPAAHGDGNEDEINDLRVAAKQAVLTLFENAIPDVERQFSTIYVEPLRNEIMASVGSNMVLPPHGVDVHLKTVADKVFAEVVDEKKLEAVNRDLAKWISTKIREESTSSFKLNRFPEIAAHFETKINSELPNPTDTVSALRTAIGRHLSIDGPSVSINYNFGNDKTMSVSLNFTNTHIASSIVHRYTCEHSRVLHELQSNSAQIVDAVINATLTAETKDACDAQRCEIEKQLEFVESAERGIRAIGEQGVPTVQTGENLSAVAIE